MAQPIAAINRLGFFILGLSNNFAYVIMLSAAVDLLKISAPLPLWGETIILPGADSPTGGIVDNATQVPQSYCNEQSTGTILLADSMPSLTMKLVYPFLLVNIRPAFKAPVVALSSASAFILTGLFTNKALIFIGVICASVASGLGEAVYLSSTPLYGDTSLIGWSMGTGAAGLLGSMAYALLKIVLSIRSIMLMMLIMPVSMMVAYFCIIKPITPEVNHQELIVDRKSELKVTTGAKQVRRYGALLTRPNFDLNTEDDQEGPFDLHAKLRHLPSLAKYFFPLTLVYLAEYFINQGLFELIYYPEITYLDHAAQYRWFQVSYQIGVVISRASLDFFVIKNIWAMSILQVVNSLLFLAHTAKWIYIPDFYIVILLIVYEGLLGGFTYVNTFYRIKKEVQPDKQAFSMSTTAIGDSIGIVTAGFLAMPIHNTLCKLYI